MPIFNVVVFVATTGDTVIRPVQAATAYEARKAFLQVMTPVESIVRIDPA